MTPAPQTPNATQIPLLTRATQLMDLTRELVRSLNDTSLALRNGTSASNSIGSQFWCVVGARESYARAISLGKWSGFLCSLRKEDSKRVDALATALDRSSAVFLKAFADGELSGRRTEFALDLIVHEAQHHGQLIRYFYANGVEFPKEFAATYALQ